MKMVLRLLLLALLFSGWAMAQTNDPTAGGAVKPATPKKNPLADARTVKSGGSESGKTEDKEKVESAVANPEEEQARSTIRPEDNSPDVGMFVVMANKGWDSVNPASPNKPVYQQVIQERGTAPTYSNNMMDSPDGSSRPNDGWKLFGWTY
ncbi:MAG: hypothetical protein ABS32_05595 [Verrucomicrobia subdivision 6 bacterium BACL9 MAG-120820-bin42]|jgi:hypothetical protein|uniref:Uncharacterized protein n=2 Tax=Verrucomicrobia subdivision 6 TaxID=134627 RepID=A0A0R2X748_9BACT|nr:MAG: hypothetical protein ABR82_02450 [Verrucomicrobia subdivision 6 bacterium BACL9 MAG-120507-bin52]KRP31898.1 MAG: hypothetical protein ABS32_05595 [Verrucomicrobia subdivision 6 bacterium BACL9 MAG-120820-bin42]